MSAQAAISSHAMKRLARASLYYWVGAFALIAGFDTGQTLWGFIGAVVWYLLSVCETRPSLEA